MSNTEPDRIWVEKAWWSKYGELRKEDVFEGKHMNTFRTALVIGFHEGVRTPLGPKKDLVVMQNIGEKEIALMKAIAIKEAGNLEVLLDLQRVFAIAEEYANTGIRTLWSEMKRGPGSLSQKLADMLLDIVKSTSQNVE